MREICRMDGMPSRTSVVTVLARDEEFQVQYARACEVRAETIFDEMLEIADDGTNDWQARQNADGVDGLAFNAEHVQRSKLRIEARKWALSKMMPKKYGDKLDVNHGGGITVNIPQGDADL